MRKHYQELGKHCNKEDTNNVANMTGKINKTSTWIVDIGAIEHMTSDCNLLDGDIDSDGEPLVLFPMVIIFQKKGEGTTVLPNGVKIAKVLYIPQFDCNLLSVS